MKSRLKEGHAVDFQDLISRFTLDVATEFLFGHCVHSLSGDLPLPHNVAQLAQSQEKSQSELFATAFREAQTVLSMRILFRGIWPFAEILTDATEGPMKIVNNLLEPILEKALAKEQNRKRADNKEEDDTLLSHLVKETKGIVL